MPAYAFLRVELIKLGLSVDLIGLSLFLPFLPPLIGKSTLKDNKLLFYVTMPDESVKLLPWMD